MLHYEMFDVSLNYISTSSHGGHIEFMLVVNFVFVFVGIKTCVKCFLYKSMIIKL